MSRAEKYIELVSENSMKKILFIALALLCMANSDCKGPEQERCTYLVVDKGSEVGSHYTLLNGATNYRVATDYFITFKNVKTGKTFVYETSNGKEYYSFQKGKKYNCRRFREDR